MLSQISHPERGSLYLSVAHLRMDPGVDEKYIDELLSYLATLEIVHLWERPHHVLLYHLS